MTIVVAYTSPLAIPYPESTDSLTAAVSAIPAAAAAKVNDLLAAVSGVAATPFVNFSTIDFSGTSGYARRAGMVTLDINAGRAAWDATTRIGILPVGYRPLRSVGFFCIASSNSTPVPVLALTDGTVRTVAAASGLGGLYGTISFAV